MNSRILASKSILPRFSMSCCSRWPEHISCDSCVNTSAEASSPPLPHSVVLTAASDRDTSSEVWTDHQCHRAFPSRSILLAGQCGAIQVITQIQKSHLVSLKIITPYILGTDHNVVKQLLLSLLLFRNISSLGRIPPQRSCNEKPCGF